MVVVVAVARLWLDAILHQTCLGDVIWERPSLWGVPATTTFHVNTRHRNKSCLFPTCPVPIPCPCMDTCNPPRRPCRRIRGWCYWQSPPERSVANTAWKNELQRARDCRPCANVSSCDAPPIHVARFDALCRVLGPWVHVRGHVQHNNILKLKRQAKPIHPFSTLLRLFLQFDFMWIVRVQRLAERIGMRFDAHGCGRCA